MPIPITAIILNKKEEELPNCLATLDRANEVLGFDSLSTEHTCEIAQQRGVRVVAWGWQKVAHPHDDIFATLEATAVSPA